MAELPPGIPSDPLLAEAQRLAVCVVAPLINYGLIRKVDSKEAMAIAKDAALEVLRLHPKVVS